MPQYEGDHDADEFDDDGEEVRSIAVDEMKEWFLERYEDPANRTPYESAEGGYIWIWGGPYDAREVLATEFSGQYPDEWIEEVVGDLEDYSFEWAPVPNEEDYDSSLFTAISSNTEPLQTLNQALVVVERLLEHELDAELSEVLLRLLYANCITIIETYLSDSFINRILNDEALLQRFLDKNPDLSRQSVPLNDVLRAVAGIKERVKRYLLDVVWHNLAKVQAMYRDTLEIEFGETIAAVARAIPRRHDIVHRNGHDKEGEEVSISSEDVHLLVDAVRTMAYAVDSQLTRSDDDLPL